MNGAVGFGLLLALILAGDGLLVLLHRWAELTNTQAGRAVEATSPAPEVVPASPARPPSPGGRSSTRPAASTGSRYRRDCHG